MTIVLAACAGETREQQPAEDTPANPETSSGPQLSDLGDALLSPAEDLNLKRAEIPPILVDLTVYTPTRDYSCGEITDEVKALTEVLGPDLTSDEQSSAADQTRDVALDTIAGASSGWIPFRWLVRRATGATAHERRIRHAYVNGIKRRAYLKGLGQAADCPPPAAPE